MSDKIEKSIELKAPVSRVWKALTDYREFGEWFSVDIEGPFVVGEEARGKMTIPGFEHVVWHVKIQEMDAERLFAFTWHPYAIEPDVDYSGEEPTLVEFKLQEVPNGTLLQVVESGFDKIPAHRRAEAFRMNDGGWAAQIKCIESYVS